MADGAPILFSYLPDEEKKRKKEGGGGGGVLLKKRSIKKWCPLHTTQMLSQHVTCKVEICRKSEVLLSSVAKEKKSEKRILIGSYIFLTYIEKKDPNITNCGETASLLHFFLQYLP